MERTCLVTKQKCAATQLLRFTVQDGQLKFDERVKNSGRGGYVVKNLTAIEKLRKLKGKIKYQLKVEGDFEISETEIEKGKAQI